MLLDVIFNKFRRSITISSNQQIYPKTMAVGYFLGVT